MLLKVLGSYMVHVPSVGPMRSVLRGFVCARAFVGIITHYRIPRPGSHVVYLYRTTVRHYLDHWLPLMQGECILMRPLRESCIRKAGLSWAICNRFAFPLRHPLLRTGYSGINGEAIAEAITHVEYHMLHICAVGYPLLFSANYHLVPVVSCNLCTRGQLYILGTCPCTLSRR